MQSAERPLVLIPGLGNTEALFDPLIEQIGQDARSHALNLILPQAENFAQMVAHAAGQLPGDSFDLLGFSMGGYVALSLALDYDLPIERLMLLNSRSVDDEEAERALRLKTLKLLANSKVKFEGMTWGLFRSLVGPAHQDDEALFALVRNMAQKVGREATAAQIRANLDRPDQQARLGEVRVPTLVVGGELDTLTPPSQARRLYQGIPKASLEVFPGCGHLSPLERPKELAALIEKFRI